MTNQAARRVAVAAAVKVHGVAVRASLGGSNVRHASRNPLRVRISMTFLANGAAACLAAAPAAAARVAVAFHGR